MASDEPDVTKAPERSATTAGRLLEESTRATGDIAETHLRAPALARIAALSQKDVALWARPASALAEAIDDPYVRSVTFAAVAQALVAADPAGSAAAAQAALRAAQTVTDVHSRTIALADAGRALGTSDRARARQVLAEAEALTATACTCHPRRLLAAVLERVADFDPERALRKAERIDDPAARGIILARAIPRLAAADPSRAVRLVERVPELHEQIAAWVGLCEALAATDPGLAVRVAEFAEADAGFSQNGIVQLNALARLSRSMHRADPVRARELLDAAEAVFARLAPSHSKSLAAAEVARAQARFDPRQAEETARRITQPHPRANAFLGLAEDLIAERRA